MPTASTPSVAPEQGALRVATDPNASSEALAQIADVFCGRNFFALNRRRVRYYRAAQAAARHPNTPLQALVRLASTFPVEVSENPGLQLEFAINGVPPNLQDAQRLFQVVPTHNITPAFHAFLERLWYDLGKPLYGALALAHHPATSARVLIDAGNRKSRDDRQAAEVFRNHLNHPGPHSTEPYTRQDAFRTVLGIPSNYDDAIAHLAYNRLLDLSVLAEFEASGAMRTSTKHTTLLARAYHPDTPDPEREAAIREFPAAELKYFSPATNPPNQGLEGVPTDAALALCLEAMRDADALVALTPNLPRAITQHLLWRTDPVVRASLALNPTTPEWALRQLLADANTRVRATARAATR